jgi:hypothetical protein
VCEDSDFAIPLPNFYVVTVNQWLCRRDCSSVVGRFEGYSRVEKTVVVDEKRAVPGGDRLGQARPAPSASPRDRVDRSALNEAKKSPDRDRGLSLKTLVDGRGRKRAAWVATDDLSRRSSIVETQCGHCVRWRTEKRVAACCVNFHRRPARGIYRRLRDSCAPARTESGLCVRSRPPSIKRPSSWPSASRSAKRRLSNFRLPRPTTAHVPGCQTVDCIARLEAASVEMS